MSSEEGSTALLPKQTPLQRLCLSSTTSPATTMLQLPCPGSPCLPRPLPHAMARPPGYNAPGCSRQPSPAQAELDVGVSPGAPPRLALQGRAKQRSGDEGVWESLCFNKIVCRLLYLHLGRVYLHDPVGLYTGEGETGAGRGATALKPALLWPRGQSQQEPLFLPPPPREGVMWAQILPGGRYRKQIAKCPAGQPGPGNGSEPTEALSRGGEGRRSKSPEGGRI